MLWRSHVRTPASSALIRVRSSNHSLPASAVIVPALPGCAPPSSAVWVGILSASAAVSIIRRTTSCR
eukprot:179809-Prymnesium_polylepis.1